MLCHLPDLPNEPQCAAARQKERGHKESLSQALIYSYKNPAMYRMHYTAFDFLFYVRHSNLISKLYGFKRGLLLGTLMGARRSKT